jgi:CHAT domain-containing protein/tetratricopeptide (TPR) repeat protein
MGPPTGARSPASNESVMNWLTEYWWVVFLPLFNPFVALLLLGLYEGWLCKRSVALRRRGEFARALRAARRAFRLARFQMWLSRLLDRLLGWSESEKNGYVKIRYPVYVGTVCALAESLRQNGDLEGAEYLLDEALALGVGIGADGADGAGYALLLCYRASCFLLHYAAADARPLLERALAVQKRVAPDEYEIGGTLLHLGLVFQQMGDYPLATRAYDDATLVFTRFIRYGWPVQADQLIVLNNRASLALETGDLDTAGRFLHQALTLAREIYGPHHPHTTTVVLNLSMWHEKKREYPESLRLVREVVRVREQVHGAGHPAHAHALHNLAATLCQTGAVDEAREAADRAMAGRTGFGEDHPLVTHALDTRARVAVLDGQPRVALELLRESVRVEQRVIGRMFSVATDGQRLSYLASVRKWAFRFLSLVYSHLRHDPEAVGAALDLVLTRKALGAEATAARRDAVLGGRYPEHAPRLRELSLLRQRVAARTLAGSGAEGEDVHRRLLTRWRQQLAALEVELAGVIPEIDLAQRLLAADRTAVAAALPAGSALVEFVRFDVFDWLALPAHGAEQWKPARYIAFVLRRADGGAELIDLGEAGAIDDLIRAFRAELLGGGPAGARGMEVFDDEPSTTTTGGPGAALRERVFDPLRLATGGAGHLVLAPDGELATLPFEVLPDAGGRPLIEAHQFSYLAVGRDALRGTVPAGVSGPPVVVAGPDFDLGATAPEAAPISKGAGVSRDLDRASLRFPLLPGTVAEGTEVAAALWVAPVLGARALKGPLKALRSPRVLHLATHGFFLPDQANHPETGGGGNLREVPTTETGEGRGERLRANLSENPLLRSGLALAGANTWLAGTTPPDGAEDGLLTAEDVTGLDLPNTELVVLSACETGLGAVRAGEGVFGLRRAFQLAGARTVVMSLWKVPDEATRELMRAFYHHLRAGVPRAEALRRAQLALKARYPDPRFWGAFILQGDTSPLSAVAPPPGGWVPAPETEAGPAKGSWRVAYDITSDYRLRPQDLFLTAMPAVLLGGAWLVTLVRLVLGYGNPQKNGETLVLIPVVLLFILGLYYLARGSWVRSQWRCRRWYRIGAHTTTEGTVVGYESRYPQDDRESRKNTVTFRIGEQQFTVESRSRKGGYRLGDPSLPGDHSEHIWNGKRLRVMHRDGRILRLEVLEAFAPAPAPAARDREPGVVYVRILVPPRWGEAPSEVCRAWVGMELPVLGTDAAAPGRAGAPPKYGGLLRGLFARRAGPAPGAVPHPRTEYEVDAPRAVALLAGVHPWAADWYRQRAPKWVEPGSTFVFPANVCEEVLEGARTSGPVAPGTPAPGPTVPSSGNATRSATGPSDPTFDPPAAPLSSRGDEIPSFLDRPPPPPPTRCRRLLGRVFFLAWLGLVAVGARDYLWGGKNAGYGVWLFDLAGALAGVYLGGALFRLTEREVARGASAWSMGRSRTGATGLRVVFLVGTAFVLAGLGITATYVEPLPASAHEARKARFEARREEQAGLAPALVLIGSLALTFGAREVRKTVRRP